MSSDDSEVERFRHALTLIRDFEGEVCGQFMVCRHRACQSSVRAHDLADAALLNHPEFARIASDYPPPWKGHPK